MLISLSCSTFKILSSCWTLEHQTAGRETPLTGSLSRARQTPWQVQRYDLSGYNTSPRARSYHLLLCPAHPTRCSLQSMLLKHSREAPKQSTLLPSPSHYTSSAPKCFSDIQRCCGDGTMRQLQAKLLTAVSSPCGIY